MSTTPALSRDIGQAERGMRALLDRKLREAELSFQEWTVLVFLAAGAPLARGELVKRLLVGHVADSTAAAEETLDRLVAAGAVAPAGAELTLTAMGESRHRPVRDAVSQITDRLYGDLPAADLEATHRTLVEIARRANTLLEGQTGS